MRRRGVVIAVVVVSCLQTPATVGSSAARPSFLLVALPLARDGQLALHGGGGSLSELGFRVFERD